VPNCTGCALYFLRLWALMRRMLTLRFAHPSELQEAEVNLSTGTRRSNLRGISKAKSDRVGRASIPNTSLLTHPIPYLNNP
jgi:hypothetical protein